MDGGTPVDAARGGKAEAQCEVVEGDVFRSQEVADGVLLARLQMHTCRGQGVPQLGMVEMFMLNLAHKEGGKTRALLHQFLHGAARAELEVKVARVHLHLDGVAARFCAKRKGKRAFQGAGCDAQFV